MWEEVNGLCKKDKCLSPKLHATVTQYRNTAHAKETGFFFPTAPSKDVGVILCTALPQDQAEYVEGKLNKTEVQNHQAQSAQGPNPERHAGKLWIRTASLSIPGKTLLILKVTSPPPNTDKNVSA